jgi:hypothetical protein
MGRAVLALSSTSVSLTRVGRRKTVPICEAAYSDPEGREEAIETVFRAERARRIRKIELVIGADLCQVRTLKRLPPVPDRALQTVVTSQASKFFRATSSGLISDAVWLSRDGGEPLAKAVAADGAFVMRLVEIVASRGVAVSGVFADVPDTPRRLTLDPPSVRRLRQLAWIRQGVAWLIVGALPWLAAGATFVGDLVVDRAQIRDELAQLEEPMAQIREIRERIADFEPIAEALANQQMKGAWATEWIAALAASLPANAHLKTLEIRRSGHARLLAIASDPPDVIRAIAALERGTPSLRSDPLLIGDDLTPWYEIEIALEPTRESS